MRLPWGEYTGIEMLDTLEVLAHERYEELLRRANVLNEAFVDHRTRAVLRRNAKGDLVSTTETTRTGVELTTATDQVTGVDGATAAAGTAKVADMETRTEAATATVGLRHTYIPRDDAPPIVVPRLAMTTVESSFSLADITDHASFRRLGEQIATNPDDQLRRTTVSARIISGPDGLRRTELVTSPAVDKVLTDTPLFPLEEARQFLVDAVLSSDIAPARNPKREINAVQPILDAFLEGLGPDAETILSAFKDRAAARLVRAVTEESRKFATTPRYDEVVTLTALGGERTSSRVVTKDRTGRFIRSKAYDGWAKSLYPVDWFDSTPERDVALMVDQDDNVRCWVRLHTNDMPILWRNDGRTYNADLIVVEMDGTHWVVEIKSDKDITSDEVLAKREAARRWVNYVNSDDKVTSQWRYVLVSENDISDAKGSWPALRALGS
jgi:type III restriction enzyme